MYYTTRSSSNPGINPSQPMISPPGNTLAWHGHSCPTSLRPWFLAKSVLRFIKYQHSLRKIQQTHLVIHHRNGVETAFKQGAQHDVSRAGSQDADSDIIGSLSLKHSKTRLGDCSQPNSYLMHFISSSIRWKRDKRQCHSS